MEHMLDAEETRVLGCLIEKEMSTPEYYPLSLNALVTACNQKSSRDPVVAYDEETVVSALDRLEEKGLVWKSMVGRVPKFEERLTADRNWVAREAAVLSVLLLRGPQTAGEIRTRTVRQHAFESLEAVFSAIEDLAEWGFVKRLAREPGRKEPRYMHMLGGDEEETSQTETNPPDDTATHSDASNERLDSLELEIAALRSEIDTLKSAFEAFRKQFE